MHIFLKFLAVLVLLVGKLDAADSARPNIVLILSDQQNSSAVGYADGFYQTPHIDELARSSLTFSNYFVAAPQCSPSRASIYTGLMPHRVGVVSNIGALHNGAKVKGLDKSAKSVADYFKQAGYVTAYVGKWHLGAEPDQRGRFDFGHFDTVFGKDEVGDEAKTKLSLDLLDKLKSLGKPFALFINYRQPHDIYHYGLFEQPDSVPESPDTKLPDSYFSDGLDRSAPPYARFMAEDGAYFLTKGDPYWQHYRDHYRQLIKGYDAEVGKILAGMKQRGLMENSILVISSDHGDMDTAHRLVYKGPFMYDQLVKSPLLVHLPGKLYPNPVLGTNDQLLSGVDILPTLLDLAGAEIPPALDGLSFRAALTGAGDGKEREFVVSEYHGKQSWENPLRMWRNKHFKLVLSYDCKLQLFDVKQDPGEVHNLAYDPSHAGAVKEITSSLINWMRASADPFLHQYGAPCGWQSLARD